MSKNKTLIKSEICADIPDVVIENLIRHNIIDENFNFNNYIKQITNTDEYKEFCAKKMQQQYEMEDELVQKDFNTSENIFKNIYKQIDKKGKKKRSKRKKISLD